MPVITLVMTVQAPQEIVFDLSRSIDLHVRSTAHTNERAVAGRTSGLIELGERVTWEATHLGFRQRLTSEITLYNRPHHFRDSMVAGAFRRFDHDHHFTAHGDATLVREVFDYTAPCGPLGSLADAILLKRYMTRLLQVRNELIKAVAESGEVDQYLRPPVTG